MWFHKEFQSDTFAVTKWQCYNLALFSKNQENLFYAILEQHLIFMLFKLIKVIHEY